MSLALPNITGPLFKLDAETLQTGITASRKSPRRRIILPIHRTQDAQVQRMINFLQPGTYIHPHQHPLDHAVESVMVIKGAIRFFVFDDKGLVTETVEMAENSGASLLDIEPRIWHSFIVTKPDTVVFEVKRGPYNAETDKTFADWAPAEGSPEAAELLRFLEK